MVKPILNSQYPLFPLRLQPNERYVETAFDPSLTLLEKVNMVIIRLNQIGKLSNDVIDQWNKVIEWILGNGLEEYVNIKLEKWLIDGTIENIINEKIFTDLNNQLQELVHQIEQIIQDVENQLEDNRKEVSETLAETHHKMIEKFLMNHSFIGKVPTRINNELDFIQGVSFNQERNEFYVARQLNNGTNVKISRYDLNTYQIKDIKQFEKSTGAYQEGLPYFYNGSGDLCFIVRTKYDLKVAIFNYTKGTLSTEIDLNGGSKISADPSGKYLVTHFGDASRIEGVYIYDMKSVINGTPYLLRKISFDEEIRNGEKTQGVTLIDNLIYLARGEDTPVMSVVNMNGVTLSTYYLDKESLGLAIKNTYALDSFNPSNYNYENEGVSWFLKNDKYYPVFHHVVGGGEGTTYFALAGELDSTEIKQTIPQKQVRDTLEWQDLTLANGVTPYGNDVIPQYAKDKSGFVHLRGACTHAYEGDNPEMLLGTINFPYLPDRNGFYQTVASGGAEATNRITITKSGEVILNATNSTNTEKPFTVLDNIIYYCEGREW